MPAHQRSTTATHDDSASWWPVRALTRPDPRSVLVDDVEIVYRTWGPTSTDRSHVVLIHGGAAHSAWWDHIAPQLATQRRVATLDLSGHGDSGRRREYHLHTWARETLAVSDALGRGRRTIVIAHSMGGATALQVASVFPDRISGVILVDPLQHDVTTSEVRARTREKFGTQRVYATRAEARSRFRVLPEQRVDGVLLSHLASSSVRRVDGGWSWKHDPEIYQVQRGVPSDSAAITAPVVAIHPEHGLSDKTNTHIFGTSVPIEESAEIAGAAHHAMLDEPVALVETLSGALARWE